MQDTRDDHEYDVRQNGLDGLSEDLDKQLEETLYDVTRNAEKQEQVISQMFGNIVGNYQQAMTKFSKSLTVQDLYRIRIYPIILEILVQVMEHKIKLTIV